MVSTYSVSFRHFTVRLYVLHVSLSLTLCMMSFVCLLSWLQVHLKFEINPYDPVILRQLFLSSSEQTLGPESRRPTLAWLEDSSSCSDLPKLEGDRYSRDMGR